MAVALDGGPGNWKEQDWRIDKKETGEGELCGQISQESGSKTLLQHTDEHHEQC